MEKNNIKSIDKWKKWAKRFGLTWLFTIIAFVIVAAIGVSPGVTFTLNGLLVMSVVAMLAFLFSKLALFITKRRAAKAVATKDLAVRPRRRWIFILLGVFIAIIGLQYAISLIPKTCQDTECFMAAAKDGEPANFQSTDKTNIEWNYKIRKKLSGDLVFTKTLLRLNDKELPQIKEFLEGKSLTCKLSGDFDERLVTTLFYGIGDNCSGELKENLGQLLFLL